MKTADPSGVASGSVASPWKVFIAASAWASQARVRVRASSTLPCSR